MMRKVRTIWAWGLIVVVICVAGCETAVSELPTPIATAHLVPVVTPTLQQLTITPITAENESGGVETAVSTPVVTITPTIPPDSGWQILHTGFEQRTIRLFTDEGNVYEQLTIGRIDPAHYQFEVGYSPNEPQTLLEWQTATGALLVVNGGFFTEEFFATGLVVVDGEPAGVSYGDFAGMFAVSDAGVDVRWLGERPYSPDESLDFALQAFPVLVKPGGIPGFPDEDGQRARRTVVAQDVNGRILFIFAPRGGFTLHGLSNYLAESDLSLDVALNLDGGTSTGMELAEPSQSIFAYTAVPTVILVYAKAQ